MFPIGCFAYCINSDPHSDSQSTIFIQFPWLLDMEPYTVRGTARRESQQPVESQPDASPETHKEKLLTQNSSEDWYQLVGVIVHSGQANAGHYYSFIKDRW